MANTFYDPGVQRAAKVQALFARIARRYDLLNDVQSFGLHRYWKRRLVRLAAVQPGQRALDLCCGTGDLALALARCGVEVTGLDFSQEMLAVARERGRKSKVQGPKSKVLTRIFRTHHKTPTQGCEISRPSPNPASGSSRASEAITPSLHYSTTPPLQFIQGDAQQLPFPDGSFDVVSVGYGLRNLADRDAGLREMQRVARAGGRLLVLDFGKPEQPVWRALYFAYLRLFVPVLGLVFCGSASAYAYILESLKRYPAQRAVAARMRELGLVNVKIVNLLGGAMSINYGEKRGTVD